MNPIRRAWEWLYPPAAPTLSDKPRNKPGGMAWIKGLQNVTGEHALNGRAVRTVALNQFGLWTIDPPQGYTATDSAIYPIKTTLIEKGGAVRVMSIGDAHLEPWKETGLSDDEVAALYAPTLTRETA